MRTLSTFLFLLALPITAFAEISVHEFKLNNGLKLVVQEDHRSPVVVSQVWYRAGSLDEVNGKTGVAHVLEHMMFKGTKRIPAGHCHWVGATLPDMTSRMLRRASVISRQGERHLVRACLNISR